MKSYSHTVMLLSACVASSIVRDASSFLAPPSAATARPSSRRIIVVVAPLSMAGFGGGGGSGSTSSTSKKGEGGGDDAAKKKLPKLKAKSQWDRYADLKQCKKVTVGVRVKGGDEGRGEWMEVGRVRSENDKYTEAAIARQRALIAEHSKRLYPVQIPANAILEWGYRTEDDHPPTTEGEGGDGEEEGKEEEDNNARVVWVIVDKSHGDDVPDNIEKKIGFEGISDKATGYYCFYNEGRIVEGRGEAGGEKTSLRSQRTASKSDAGTKPGGASRGS